MIIVRNALLTAATIASHLSDDPVLLLAQGVRRLPPTLSNCAARTIRSAPGPVMRALGSHLTGDTQRRDSIIDSAINAGARTSTAARLVDVALIANDPARADQLLALTGPAAGVRARRRWFDGDMTGAVAVLRAAGHRRRARALEGELRVFQGWSPQLDKVASYTPKGRTVLHLLTNSLPHTASGYAQRSHSILRAQADLGWDVHAATRLGYPVQVGKLLAHDTDVRDGVKYHRLLTARMPAGFDERLQLQAEMLLQLAVELRPAILHTTTHFVNGLVVGEVAAALGIPWVYEVRGQLADTWASSRPARAKQSERYTLFSDREAQVMHNASLVVTLGEGMKQKIMSVGVAAERILLSPNAVGQEYLAEPIPSVEARRRLGLPEAGVFVGTVSSLVDYEGLDDLLRAVALLAPSQPALRCLIVGDGVARPSLEQLAKELGIRDRVIFTGRVPRADARIHHLALDIFAVPRRNLDVTRSVTPLKPIEAMACSRPVVASDLPALREIVTGGISGVLVTPEDPAALAEGIGSLLGQGSLAAAGMGAEGRREVLEDRTWAGNAAVYERAYVLVGAE